MGKREKKSKRPTQHRKKYKLKEPYFGKLNPPFGANKKTGDANAKERFYLNQIHGLEQALAEMRKNFDQQTGLLERTQRLVLAQEPTTNRIHAMRSIATKDLIDLVRVGIQWEANTLALWVLDLDAARENLDSGKSRPLGTWRVTSFDGPEVAVVAGTGGTD